MKKLLIIICVCLIAAAAYATQYYYYKIGPNDEEVSKFHKNQQIPAATTAEGYVNVEVTQQQYQDGFQTVTQQEKDDARDAAEIEDADYTEWSARERAMIDAFRKLVVPVKSEAEMKALILIELQNQ